VGQSVQCGRVAGLGRFLQQCHRQRPADLVGCTRELERLLILLLSVHVVLSRLHQHHSTGGGQGPLWPLCLRLCSPRSTSALSPMSRESPPAFIFFFGRGAFPLLVLRAARFANLLPPLSSRHGAPWPSPAASTTRTPPPPRDRQRGRRATAQTPVLARSAQAL